MQLIALTGSIWPLAPPLDFGRLLWSACWDVAAVFAFFCGRSLCVEMLHDAVLIQFYQGHYFGHLGA